MNAARQKPENYWRNLGRNCANLGWPIERALTGRRLADGWIREGYAKGKRKKGDK